MKGKLLATAMGFMLLPACMPDFDDNDPADSGTDTDYDYDNPDIAELPIGCWEDPTTGYLWEEPDVWGLSHSQAIARCDALVLNGHGPGEWHLPTISELRTLIAGCPATQTDGPCGVTDDCLGSTCRNDFCDGCDSGSGPGTSGCYSYYPGGCYIYYSSSLNHTEPGAAWTVGLSWGDVLSWQLHQMEAHVCVYTGS